MNSVRMCVCVIVCKCVWVCMCCMCLCVCVHEKQRGIEEEGRGPGVLGRWTGCRACKGGLWEWRIPSQGLYLTWDVAPSWSFPCYPQFPSVLEKRVPGSVFAQLFISSLPETQSIQYPPQHPTSKPWSQCHSLCYAPHRPLPGTDPGFPTVYTP